MTRPDDTTIGTVLAVTQTPLGGELTADTATAATSLSVDDVADFDEAGGTLVVGFMDDAGTAEVIVYSTTDPDANTVTLGAGLAADWDAGTRVYLWDTTTSTPSVEYHALVAAPGSIDNDDAIDAIVTHALIPLLPEGIRDPGAGESVTLSRDGTQWLVTDIRGKQPQLAGGMLAPDSVPRAALSFTVGATTVTVGAAAPTPAVAGDLWINSGSDNQVNQFDGSTWLPVQFGTGAIAAGAVTTDLLAAGAVAAGKIAVGALDAQTIHAAALTAGILSAGTIGSSTMVGSTITDSDFIVDTSGGRILIYQAATPTVTTILTTGAGSWTAPAGVTVVKVEAVGAGCGGQAGNSTLGGDGGGGGEYAIEPNYPVTPGNSYAYHVGFHGTGGGSNWGSLAEDTTFDAAGAAGGVLAHGAPLYGDPGTGSANTIHFTGGYGGHSAFAPGAGGGSSGGSLRAGNNGHDATSGAAGAGGAAPDNAGPGAAGGASAGAGSAGGVPGGGGGGGGKTKAGGAGGHGMLRLSYVSAAPVLIASIAASAGSDQYGNAYPPGPNGFVPAGAVMPYAGASTPAGWLLCDGTAVSRTTYAALYAVLGSTYGAGNGSTTFNLPDLRGAVPLGVKSGLNALGGTGGALTHTHPLSDDGQAAIALAASSPSIIERRVTSVSWTATHSENIANAAGNTSSQAVGAALRGNTDSASSLPPWVGLNYIIKT